MSGTCPAWDCQAPAAVAGHSAEQMDGRLLARGPRRWRPRPPHSDRRTTAWPRSLSSDPPSSKPIRVAICGAGPAGFYAAKRLFALDQHANPARPLAIDLFEALPTPFGLSRYGVAPDHPEVKNCESKFEQVARHPRLRYFGNTAVLGDGQPPPSGPQASVRLTSLRQQYDGVLLAYGAGEDRTLGGLPGETTLANILPARAAVDWYNGYPRTAATAGERRKFVDLSQVERVTIIGMGNVALDIARILLTDVDVLAKTDMDEAALSELSRSRVRHVEIVGRRGPLQAAFTTRELRELAGLPGLALDIDQPLLADAAARIAPPGVLGRMPNGRLAKRLLDVMIKASQPSSLRPTRSSCALRFLHTPLAFHGAQPSDTAAPARVAAVDWIRNTLEYPADASRPVDHAALKAVPLRPLTIHASATDLVLKSLGSVPHLVPPLTHDAWRSRAKNEQGRALDAANQSIPGLYVTGWLATGSKGVIGDTMTGAYDRDDAEPALDNKQFCVDWHAWTVIDQAERHSGKLAGRPRVKLSSVHDMLAVAGLL
ncbi:hypothetical protein PtA15_13A229 [Puccinia triticina]|uniref:NADPH:adrenodoxin oxidoreductase, mitochondrial n=1 Tax=Puccinia triticina TaxID=208348 RepID=A0ABY7D4A4_9BASI|nr:uncharacterized protein PtA15_13A229 [Puccinia triticina]WAQ90830.1 hypothetical protein PtA15_13A229 [Puccinia triticina]